MPQGLDQPAVDALDVILDRLVDDALGLAVVAGADLLEVAGVADAPGEDVLLPSS